MEAAIRRRILRAPPPTPIATGNGRRSAAVDDRVLTQYLETSLRVPDLALPKPYPSKSPIAKTLTKLISLSSLVSGQDSSVGEMMASAAAEIGAFSIDAGDPLAREDVRDLIEVGREVAGSGEEKEMVLGEEANEEAYRILREKRRKLPLNWKWLLSPLQKSFRNMSRTKPTLQSFKSCIQLYALEGEVILISLSEDAALSLHITGSDRKFCIHFPRSTFVTPPSGCILATVGKQFEEFCNSELKGFDGEIFLEPSAGSSLSLEFMYSLPVLNQVPSPSSSKTVSMDQLLILLILAFLYNLWS